MTKKKKERERERKKQVFASDVLPPAPKRIKRIIGCDKCFLFIPSLPI